MAKSTRGLNCSKPTKVSGGRTNTKAAGVSSRKPWLTYPSEKYEFVSWDDFSYYGKQNSCLKPPTRSKYDVLLNEFDVQLLISMLLV